MLGFWILNFNGYLSTTILENGSMDLTNTGTSQWYCIHKGKGALDGLTRFFLNGLLNTVKRSRWNLIFQFSKFLNPKITKGIGKSCCRLSIFGIHAL
mmetsp:Transcript_86111/g.248605  ORF Transcript_86111/g.248605 Transcript_86111/m.248605 type:complete len:97 (+) Transcript_86111:240-530(+)